MSAPRISIAAFVTAPPRERARGLLGWLTIEVEELLLLDSIALRQSRGGRMVLSFPAPRDQHGQRMARIRPVNDAARRAIEDAVFEALGSVEGVR